MAKVFHDLKRSWQLFIHDQPGQRFVHHYRRSQLQRSAWKTVLRIGVGVLLTAGGVVLWVLPGPGWLFVIFGLAMFAGESRTLSALLDRAEVFVRAQLHRLAAWWRTASPVRR